MFGLQNPERVHFCCFEPPSSGTWAALENKYTRPHTLAAPSLKKPLLVQGAVALSLLLSPDRPTSLQQLLGLAGALWALGGEKGQLRFSCAILSVPCIMSSCKLLFSVEKRLQEGSSAAQQETWMLLN